MRIKKTKKKHGNKIKYGSKLDKNKKSNQMQCMAFEWSVGKPTIKDNRRNMNECWRITVNFFRFDNDFPRCGNVGKHPYS